MLPGACFSLCPCSSVSCSMKATSPAWFLQLNVPLYKPPLNLTKTADWQMSCSAILDIHRDINSGGCVSFCMEVLVCVVSVRCCGVPGLDVKSVSTKYRISSDLTLFTAVYLDIYNFIYMSVCLSIL